MPAMCSLLDSLRIGCDSKLHLPRKIKIDLQITHKLFALVAFVLYGILPQQQPALGETQTIGSTNRFINPDVAVVSLAGAFFKVMASPIRAPVLFIEVS